MEPCIGRILSSPRLGALFHLRARGELTGRNRSATLGACGPGDAAEPATYVFLITDLQVGTPLEPTGGR